MPALLTNSPLLIMSTQAITTSDKGGSALDDTSSKRDASSQASASNSSGEYRHKVLITFFPSSREYLRAVGRVGALSAPGWGDFSSQEAKRPPPLTPPHRFAGEGNGKC